MDGRITPSRMPGALKYWNVAYTPQRFQERDKIVKCRECKCEIKTSLQNRLYHTNMTHLRRPMFVCRYKYDGEECRHLIFSHSAGDARKHAATHGTSDLRIFQDNRSRWRREVAKKAKELFSAVPDTADNSRSSFGSD